MVNSVGDVFSARNEEGRSLVNIAPSRLPNSILKTRISLKYQIWSQDFQHPPAGKRGGLGSHSSMECLNSWVPRKYLLGSKRSARGIEHIFFASFLFCFNIIYSSSFFQFILFIYLFIFILFFLI